MLLTTDGFTTNFDIKDHNILIVDDNPTNLAVIVDYLEDSGLTILVSQDGESSLKRAKYAQPSIILLDVLMPGIDGYETCRLLKQDPETKDIPIIFMTALSSTEDKVKGFKVGAVDYITKPIQPEEVLARINLHLERSFMTTILAEQNNRLSVEIEQRKATQQKLNQSNQKLKAEVNERIYIQQELKKLNDELENRVEKRTTQLTKTNYLLQQEISERKQAEAKVRNSLEEKEILLKEIYHRVKNNLLVVSSLLEMQSNCFDDPEITKVFRNSQHRLHSMALIHEQLYQSKNLKQLNFGNYLNVLTKKLSESYDTSEEGVEINMEVESINLSLETAHTCGLIVNELIANSLEHGFVGRKGGNIWLELKQAESCGLRLQIKDDGIGIPDNIDFFNSDSLGLKLVRILTRQLEGELSVEQNQGTCFTIQFGELDYCDRI